VICAIPAIGGPERKHQCFARLLARFPADSEVNAILSVVRLYLD